MECLPVSTLPEGPDWTYEIKLDGFRLQAVKQGGEVTLYSRRGNVLNKKFRYVADALKRLPDSTILDGEFVTRDIRPAPTDLMHSSLVSIAAKSSCLRPESALDSFRRFARTFLSESPL